MKAWDEMTERERDVLICQTLGWEVMEVLSARTFKKAQESGNWYPMTTHNYTGKSYASGWLDGPHWTRNGDNIHYGKITNEGMEDRIKLFELPRFSTDRAAAMTLLDGFVTYILAKNHNGKFSVTVADPKNHPVQTAMGETEPEAICRAFLCAKGVEIETKGE